MKKEERKKKKEGRGKAIGDWGVRFLRGCASGLWRRRCWFKVKRSGFSATLAVSCLCVVALGFVLHHPAFAFLTHPPPHLPTSPTPSYLLAQTPTDPWTAYRQGNYETAREQWEQAANQAAQANNLLEELPNRINEVQALKALGAYQRAEGILKDTLDKTVLNPATAQGDKNQILQYRTQLLRLLGDVYQAIGKSDQAYRALTCSLTLAQSPQDIGAANFSLGMAERATIIPIASRTLVIQADYERSNKLVNALKLLGLASAQPESQSVSSPSSTQPLSNGICLEPIAQLLNSQQQELTRPEVTQPRMVDYFKAAQPNLDATGQLKAQLNQISLLVNLLPQMNTFLAKTINFSKKLEGDHTSFFINNFLAESSLKKQLKALLATRKLPGQAPAIDPVMTDLQQFHQRATELTEQLIELLLPSSTDSNAMIDEILRSQPADPDRVAMRINYARSLFNLKRVLDTAEGVDYGNSQVDGVNYQLRRKLNTILQKNKFAKTSAASNSTASNTTRQKSGALSENVSLFLPEKTRASLQTLVRNSLSKAAMVVSPAIAEAQSLKNHRLEAAARLTLAEVYSTSAKLNVKPEPPNTVSPIWTEVKQLAGQALTLVQGQDAPDLIFQAQRLYALALSREQGKTPAARAACQVAASTLQANRSNLVAVDQEVQYTFRDSVEPFYRECITVLLPTPQERSDLQQMASKPIQDNLEAARNLVESLQLAELDNFFREACINGQKIKIDDLVNQRKITETAVLYPILLSKSQVGVIAKIPNVPNLQYEGTPQLVARDLETFLLDFRNQLANSQTPSLNTSQQIYKWVVRPFQSQLDAQNVKTLVFVPDGPFRNVPMSALHDGERYLVEKYAIALSPGLQLLEPKVAERKSLNAVAAGLTYVENPEVQPGPFRWEDIKAEFDALKTTKILTQDPLRDQAFTSQNLTQQLESLPFNVIHLSTHAGFSSRKEDTFIRMADDRITLDRFGEILRRRQQSQTIPLELLVLSACETATGDSRATLGLTGIALKAGARSTVAALWPVLPKATTELIARFYEKLAAAQQNQQTKAQVLQEVQKELLKKYPPADWAAFVLVGDWL